jgi:hypothetical protein
MLNRPQPESNAQLTRLGDEAVAEKRVRKMRNTSPAVA